MSESLNLLGWWTIVFGQSYVIAVGFLALGFVPFYVNPFKLFRTSYPFKVAFEFILAWIGIALIFISISKAYRATESDFTLFFTVLIPMGLCFLGYRIRKRVKAEDGKPLGYIGWVIERTPIIGPHFVANPMLLFDAVTIGFSLVMAFRVTAQF